MEDISRELEKEIAQSKPKPYKKDKVTRILIVDDFGRMKSGEYLKYLVRILSAATLVCFVAAVLFYKLYSDVSKNTGMTKKTLAKTQEKVENLTKEKEVLMARLVILGKEPDIKEKKPEIEEKKTSPVSGKKVKSSTADLQSVKPDNVPKADKIAVSDPGSRLDILDTAKRETASATGLKPIREQLEKPSSTQTVRAPNDMVAIEKFTVVKEGDGGDLLVRFDIRNISKEQGEVSGRIFTVLKPGTQTQDNWLVIPTAPLHNGVPSEFRKGQYFSISRFKPVKFRIKNMEKSDFFQKASIYIFNNQGELIFEALINITEAE